MFGIYWVFILYHQCWWLEGIILIFIAVIQKEDSNENLPSVDLGLNCQRLVNQRKSFTHMTTLDSNQIDPSDGDWSRYQVENWSGVPLVDRWCHTEVEIISYNQYWRYEGRPYPIINIDGRRLWQLYLLLSLLGGRYEPITLRHYRHAKGGGGVTDSSRIISIDDRGGKYLSYHQYWWVRRNIYCICL